MFDVIAFDADDTLWHNETIYSLTQEKLKQLLAKYRDIEDIEGEIYQTERRNLQYFGYGIKSFTLSMIETAIELTNGEIQGREINQIINFAKEMLETPTQLLDDVAETVATLAQSHTLMIITKGDLFDQETKIAQSGLADYFTYVEIVSEKTPGVYRGLLERYGLSPNRFLMIGNSLRSDVLPVIELGGRAVHVPYSLTWAHEIVTGPEAQAASYFELEKMSQLPALLADLNRKG